MKEEEELVKALIADHLRHLKLMSGLEKIGFDTLDYYLGLPEVIFKLMDIEKSETIFLYYTTAAELMCEKKEAVKAAAETLYEDLVWMREEFKS